MLAARIATVPVVREILRGTQRAIGEASPLVAEGRDMGTVVFPDARFKFFLDAAPEVRAMRRLHDLESRGQHEDLATLTEQIRQRDALDRNRTVAPLRPAPDALMVDTSQLDIEGVLGVILHHIDVHAAMADAKPEDTVLVCGSFHTVAHARAAAYGRAAASIPGHQQGERLPGHVRGARQLCPQPFGAVARGPGRHSFFPAGIMGGFAFGVDARCHSAGQGAGGPAAHWHARF